MHDDARMGRLCKSSEAADDGSDDVNNVHNVNKPGVLAFVGGHDWRLVAAAVTDPVPHGVP